ncbi:MAG: hypothetical protein Q7L07_01595 [Pseudohongiella sp.]|nr:hypothetical protein [Pseudohongiella sp.]
MNITMHAEVRLQQRGISRGVIEAVIALGDFDSRDGISISRRKLQELLAENKSEMFAARKRRNAAQNDDKRQKFQRIVNELQRRQRLLERTENVRVVYLSDSVLTVYRTSETTQKHIGRRSCKAQAESLSYCDMVTVH